MKTKKTVLLTALACCTLFTLFAYCTKDGAEQTTISDLTGTSWMTKTGIGNDDGIVSIYAHFTTSNSGNYTFSWKEGKSDDENYNYSFTYSLNSSHGKINSNMRWDDGENGTKLIPNNATIIIIDENTIGIGGRVFTRQ